MEALEVVACTPAEVEAVAAGTAVAAEVVTTTKLDLTAVVVAEDLPTHTPTTPTMPASRLVSTGATAE